MRSLALAAIVAAAPASAQRLGGFEKQFVRKASAAPAPPPASASPDPSSSYSAAESQAAGDALYFLLKLPLLPFAYALGEPERARGRHDVSAAVHHIEDRVRGWGGAYRYSGRKHAGFEAHWTAYLEEGAQYDLHYVGARAIAELLDHEHWSLDYGLGISGLVGSLGRGGPDFSLATEYRSGRCFVDARAGAVIMEGGTLGELRAGAGLRWGDAELRAGYKALVGPFDTLDGPEIGLRLRL